MKRESDLELDDIFRKAVRDIVEEVDPPPIEESWLEFKKKLEKRTGVKPSSYNKRNRLKGFFVAASILILLTITISLSFPLKARAIGKKVLSTIEILLYGTQVNIKTSYEYNEENKPFPPNGAIKEIEIGQEQIMSLEELKATAPYKVLIPQYVPESYSLNKVKYRKLTVPIAETTLIYSNTQSVIFTITQINTPGGHTESYVYDYEDATAKDIFVGQDKVKMLVFKNNKVKIMGVKDGISFEVEGQIPVEEALKIVESLLTH